MATFLDEIANKQLRGTNQTTWQLTSELARSHGETLCLAVRPFLLALLGPTRVWIGIDNRLRNLTRNLRTQVRTVSSLVAGVAVFQQVLVGVVELLAILGGDGVLELRQRAVIDAIEG